VIFAGMFAHSSSKAFRSSGRGSIIFYISTSFGREVFKPGFLATAWQLQLARRIHLLYLEEYWLLQQTAAGTPSAFGDGFGHLFPETLEYL